MGAAGEGGVEDAAVDLALELFGDQAGAASGDAGKRLAVGVAGAGADAGGEGDGGEEAAGRGKDQTLAPPLEVVAEGGLAGRVASGAGGGAVGDRAGAALGDGEGGVAVFVFFALGDVGGHGDDPARDPVDLDEGVPIFG